MKLFTLVCAFFAGAVMAAPVPDNSIHQRGRMDLGTPLETRGGAEIKRPIAERGIGPILDTTVADVETILA
ncbi:hypothetical protein BDV26DRAFT_267919 [Aspergillus bertholletiae]|uniref:Uncharacterized protein n=1 Tax=Aspergillus bertholletiae TaxID=1226010 RepID=A0A5N7B063_9EURO|nr:hypothetical protein BDV26DRAFT_267919 [Aspergillus bertholletiae]